MNEVWVAIIGVGGALLGSVSGAWMTSRVARQAQDMTYRVQSLRERREAFCEAVNALLSYRIWELRRVEESRSTGLSVDDVPSATAAREARSSCRYHLVVLRVLMPGDETASRYAQLLDQTHRISRDHALDAGESSGTALAASVKTEIEAFAQQFGERLARGVKS